jgi:hypothetical protein
MTVMHYLVSELLAQTRLRHPYAEAGEYRKALEERSRVKL